MKSATRHPEPPHMKTQAIRRFIDRFTTRLDTDRAGVSLTEMGPASRDTQRWELAVDLQGSTVTHSIEMMGRSVGRNAERYRVSVWSGEVRLVHIRVGEQANLTPRKVADMVITSLDHLADLFSVPRTAASE